MRGSGRRKSWPAEPVETFTVSGAVLSSQSAAVGGLRVEAVDKGVGPDLSLAGGATDAAGHYSLQFSSAKFTSRGKAAPDIQVRVFSGQALLAASNVRYNASAITNVDVVLPAAAAAALPSEHESLTASLAVHFKGHLRDLKEDARQQDITYLSNKSGWDARAVALAALADQFSQATVPPATKTRARATVGPRIQPEFFYALFRAGLPANPDTVYQTNQTAVVNVWKQAITQGVIPKRLEESIPQAQQAFQALSAQTLLTAPAPAGVSRLTDVLAVSGLKSDQQQKIASLYTANRRDLPAFWKSVGDSLGQDVVKRVQLNGKLGFLTINNAPLMQALQQQVTGPGRLSDPAQLAKAGFHRPEKWTPLIGANIPIPSEIPGDATTRKANYAAYLAAQVRLGYPPTVIAPFRDVYVRFLKTTSLGSTLRMTADELVRFANDADYQINADGWLNALPTNGVPRRPPPRRSCVHSKRLCALPKSRRPSPRPTTSC
jgi:hypothetical protein